jgi:hypothetical protein
VISIHILAGSRWSATEQRSSRSLKVVLPAIVFFGWVTGGTTSNDGNGGGTMEGLYQVDRGFGKVVTGYADTSAKWEVFGGIAVFSRYMLFSQC